MIPLIESLPSEEPEPIPEYVDLQDIMTSFDSRELAIPGIDLLGLQYDNYKKI